MQSKRAHRLQLISENRAVVALHPTRKARARDAAGAQFSARPRRPDPDAALAYAGKIDLAAEMTAALSAEAQCLRIPLPADLIQRLAHVEAELEMLRHDVLAQGDA